MSDNEEEVFQFAVAEDLVPSRAQKSAGILELDFAGLLATPLRLHEDVKEGNGGQAWPAGMILAEFLIKHHLKELGDRTMIELGAGGGLVGLALSLALSQRPSTRIYVTDLPPMLPLMKQNIELNSGMGMPASTQPSGAAVTPLVYSWGEAPPSELPTIVPPDIILAADCVYFEPAFPLLLKTLSDLIGEKTVCWFCFKRRRRADMGFARDLKKQFAVFEIGVDDDRESTSAERESWKRENIHLYRVTKKSQ